MQKVAVDANWWALGFHYLLAALALLLQCWRTEFQTSNTFRLNNCGVKKLAFYRTVALISVLCSLWMCSSAGTWETKVSNREKRQQRRKDKGAGDESGSPGRVGTAASVPNAEQTMGTPEEPKVTIPQNPTNTKKTTTTTKNTTRATSNNTPASAGQRKGGNMPKLVLS